MVTSRRDFLKLSGAALGGLWLSKHAKSALAAPEVSHAKEEIQIGNLLLTPVIAEHRKDTWEHDRESVMKELATFPIIIPEYFPPEYEQLVRENLALGQALDFVGYDNLNYAFREVSEQARKDGKEIWVVDPAYSTDAVWLRIIENRRWAAAVAAPSAALNVGLGLGAALSKKGSLERKAFVAVAGALDAMGAAAAGVVTAHVKDDTETDLRRVFIARSLIELGKAVEPGTKAAIFYPDAHWNGDSANKSFPLLERGVAYYLTHPDDLEAQWKTYTKDYPVDQYPDFYKIRHYLPTEDGKNWYRMDPISNSG